MKSSALKALLALSFLASFSSFAGQTLEKSSCHKLFQKRLVEGLAHPADEVRQFSARALKEGIPSEPEILLSLIKMMAHESVFARLAARSVFKEIHRSWPSLLSDPELIKELVDQKFKGGPDTRFFANRAFLEIMGRDLAQFLLVDPALPPSEQSD